MREVVLATVSRSRGSINTSGRSRDMAAASLKVNYITDRYEESHMC